MLEFTSNVKKGRHAKEVVIATMATETEVTTLPPATTKMTGIPVTGPVAIIDSNNAVSLPGSNIHQSANSVTKATTTVSRATHDDNHVAPTFTTGKYSASLSTAYGVNF